MATSPRLGLAGWIAVPMVSGYLLLVGAWLLATRRIVAPGLGRALLAAVRRPYRGTIAAPVHDEGHGWIAPLPAHLCSDEESWSRIRLSEDDRELGPSRCPHAEIRALGGGRYSHWGRQLYFSTSDNSSPLTNGRTYTVREHR